MGVFHVWALGLGILLLMTVPVRSASWTEQEGSLLPYFKVRPSVRAWDVLSPPAKRFSVLSVVVDHHTQTKWYIPSLHKKHSVGWNRTRDLQFNGAPFACDLRFVGVGLQDALRGFEDGGTGYLTLAYKPLKGKDVWMGFDKNETNRLHCYYHTSFDTGSDFKVTVPISL
ncbi:hypothetical protein B484DRAFT_166414, partial [Ochromonadaceae sp. CCMP2298]